MRCIPRQLIVAQVYNTPLGGCGGHYDYYKSGAALLAAKDCLETVVPVVSRSLHSCTVEKCWCRKGLETSVWMRAVANLCMICLSLLAGYYDTSNVECVYDPFRYCQSVPNPHYLPCACTTLVPALPQVPVLPHCKPMPSARTMYPLSALYILRPALPY